MKPELLASLLSPVFIGCALGSVFFVLLGLVQWIRDEVWQSAKGLGSFFAAISLAMTALLWWHSARTGQEMPWEAVWLMGAFTLVIMALPYVVIAVVQAMDPHHLRAGSSLGDPRLK